MCIIMAKEAGLRFSKNKIDFSHKSNKDGFGAMWYDTEAGAFGKVKTYKTLVYKEFITFLKSNNYLKDYKAVLHLRYATVGAVTVENVHPFDVANIGSLMHNGTITGYTNVPDISDSQAISLIIGDTLKCLIPNSADAVLGSNGFAEMLKGIIGTYINRVAILTAEGNLHIYNRHLGETVRGIWYSNDYYKKERYVAPNYNLEDDEPEWWNQTYNPSIREDIKSCSKVFVYGTLKKGFSNSKLLSTAEYVGDYETVSKWAMVGKGMPFPFLIQRDLNGEYIQGEVYNINAVQLRRLDRLEGYPSLYNRTEIMVEDKLDDKITETVWVYYKKDMGYTKKELISEFTK